MHSIINILVIILKAILYIVLTISVIFGTSALTLWLLGESFNLKIDRQTLITSQIVIKIILAFAVILLCIFLLVKFYRLLLTHRKITGTNNIIRLTGLSVATLLFPNAVYSLFIKPVQFIINLTPKLFSIIHARAASEISDKVDSQSRLYFIEFANTIIDFIGNMTINIVNEFERFLRSIPVTDIIFALTVWVIIGQLFFDAETESEGIKGFKFRDNKLIKKFLAFMQEKKQKENLLIISIFLISAFLSISAIVAIPWLTEDTSRSELDKEHLQQRMTATLISGTEFNEKYPANYRLTFDPFSALSPYFKYNSDTLKVKLQLDSLSQISIQQWQSFINQPDNIVQILKGQRLKLHERWNTYREEIKSEQKAQFDKILNDFELESLSPMSMQHRITYFQKLDSYFQGLTGTFRYHLNSGLDKLRRFDNAVLAYVNFMTSDLDQRLLEIKQYELSGPREKSNMLKYGWYNNSASSIDLMNRFALDFGRQDFVIPDIQQFARPEPGLNWGPFGWISRWLLRTKSIPLAMITGMLGFGLLGAAISTFVRKKAQDIETMSTDFKSILIRGLSAAVIIYLAVKGGIAIFTTSSNEPNAYVLFFTCLAGAVFSEDVWNWAHDKLFTNN